MAIIKRAKEESKMIDVTYSYNDGPCEVKFSDKKTKHGQHFHISDVDVPGLTDAKVGKEVTFTAVGILKSAEIRKTEDGKTKQSYTIEVTKLSV